MAVNGVGVVRRRTWIATVRVLAHVAREGAAHGEDIREGQ